MPQEDVLFLLLEAHTTCFLVLEFQEQSCALLNCHSPTSKTHFLSDIHFDSVPHWEHCVNHQVTCKKLAFPYPLMMHPKNSLHSAIMPLHLSHTDVHLRSTRMDRPGSERVQHRPQGQQVGTRPSVLGQEGCAQ